MLEVIYDWFELHVQRTPHHGPACVTYRYGGPQEPHRTLDLSKGVSRACRGDPTLTGEYPIVELHLICNDDPAHGQPSVGLARPWILGDENGMDVRAATVVIDGLKVRAALRFENGDCGPWQEQQLIPLPGCRCPSTEPGFPCKTPPCPE